MPRFNEKSLARLAEGLAETGAIAPEGFRRTVEAARRFRAIAEAMGVAKLDVTATEAIRRATNGKDLVDAIAAEAGLTVRILSGAEEARYAALGVISGFFRPVGAVGDMGGGSLEVPRRSTTGSATPGPACRSARCRSRPCSPRATRSPSGAWTTSCAPGSRRRSRGRLFYPVGGGWRALAKAHIEAVGAPVKAVHGYAVETPGLPRLREIDRAAAGGEARRHARRLGAAGANAARRRADARPGAEAARA